MMWGDCVVLGGNQTHNMEANLEQLKCGQCGTEKHLVYQRPNGEMLLECIMCGSTSEIKLTQPKIVIRNVSGLGTICPQS